MPPDTAAPLPVSGWCLGVLRDPHYVDLLHPDPDGPPLCVACRLRLTRTPEAPSG